jgi:hypothetical protein
VDPVNPTVHTNNIEHLWRSLKADIRGVGIENLTDSIDCFMLKRISLSGDLFDV